MYLELSNVIKHYGAEMIFQDITCYVDSNDVIGLVGNNGVGKSTLCNLITGTDEEFDGNITFHPGTKVAYFRQSLENVSSDDSQSVFEYILETQKDILAIEDEYQCLLGKLEREDPHQDEIDKLGDLQDKYYSSGAYNLLERIEKVLHGLGIYETGDHEEATRNITWETKISELSGGERKIVELATILLNQTANVLILDEPTNHLDMEARIWLEKFIKGFQGSVIIVSHDRYMLNNVANKIWEIADHTLTTFKGNFDRYKEQKEEVFKARMKQYENEKKELERLKSILAELRKKLDKGAGPAIVAQYNATKSRIEKHEKKMIKRPETRAELSLKLPNKMPKGYTVLKLNKFSFEYSTERKIFESTNFVATKNDKIALLGGNGTGKSTLLKLMLAKYCEYHHINPKELGIDEFYQKFITSIRDTDTFSIGPGNVIGYYSQHHTQLDTEVSIRQFLWDKGIREEGQFQSIVRRYHFETKTVDDKKIGDLSGGEKSKLQFMLLMLQEPNTLLLDEPINHLDIDSMQVVEDVLSDFKGALFVISHDRYFLNRVVNRIAYIENLKLNEFFGSIDEYLERYS